MYTNAVSRLQGGDSPLGRGGAAGDGVVPPQGFDLGVSIDMGTIRAICVSKEKGTPKTAVLEAELAADYGINGDAHAGSTHRQVSLLSYEKINQFAAVEDGVFGENLVVSGIDLSALPVGTVLRCGAVLLELTQIGKECHDRCQIYHRMGDCIMPREGVFARVLQGGTIKTGDEIIVTEKT